MGTRAFRRLAPLVAVAPRLILAAVPLGGPRLSQAVPGTGSASPVVRPSPPRIHEGAVAPGGGGELLLLSRSLVLQPAVGEWVVTDFLQIRVNGDRALGSGADGVIWEYPLPAGVAEGEVASTEFDGRPGEVVEGRLKVTSALPPGDRVIVVRYSVPSPYFDLPLPGRTDALNVLIREPGPALVIEGMSPAAAVSIEPGSTYRRYASTGLLDATIRIGPSDRRRPPTPRAVAVVFACVLLTVGGWSVRGVMSGRSSGHGAGSAQPPTRRRILQEIAILDEDFESLPVPSPEAEAVYREQRQALLSRL